VEEAWQLILKERNAVENLAALLLRRGFPTVVTGVDALAIIRPSES
jgi:hypothetical protein